MKRAAFAVPAPITFLDDVCRGDSGILAFPIPAMETFGNKSGHDLGADRR
jgi:hypothetical protein